MGDATTPKRYGILNGVEAMRVTDPDSAGAAIDWINGNGGQVWIPQAGHEAPFLFIIIRPGVTYHPSDESRLDGKVFTGDWVARFTKRIFDSVNDAEFREHFCEIGEVGG